MDECINERQAQSKRGEGEDEISLKKQKIDIVERQAQHRPDRLKKPRTGLVGTDR